MTRAQVETIMASTQSKGKYGPWHDNFDEMARKTCIRRLAKVLKVEPCWLAWEVEHGK